MADREARDKICFLVSRSIAVVLCEVGDATPDGHSFRYKVVSNNLADADE